METLLTVVFLFALAAFLLVRDQSVNNAARWVTAVSAVLLAVVILL